MNLPRALRALAGALLLSAMGLGGLAAAAQPVEVRAVVANGLGGTVAEAAQNAAHNALVTVVGSFMDASQVLQKRSQIEEGVRRESSQVRTDIREYSQGSIRGFEILESSSEAGLVRVTARVTVRVDDFRAYIQQLAAGETAIGGGLFARMATQQRQERDLRALLQGLVDPLIGGKVVHFDISEPFPAADLMRDARTRLSDGNAWRFFIEAHGLASIVAFDVVARLDAGYATNLVDTLENTATLRMPLDDVDDNARLNAPRSAQAFAQRVGQAGGTGLIWNPANRTGYNGYMLALAPNELPRGLAWLPTCRDSHWRHEVPFPTLEVTLLDAGGRVLQLERVGAEDRERRGAGGEPRVLVPDLHDGRYPQVPWIPMSCSYTPGGSNWPVLHAARQFRVLLAVRPDTLRDAQRLRLQLIE